MNQRHVCVTEYKISSTLDVKAKKQLQMLIFALLVISHLSLLLFPLFPPFLCCVLYFLFTLLLLRSIQTCLIVACCTSEGGSVWALLPTGTMRFQPPWWRRFHANCPGRVTHTHANTHSVASTLLLAS